MDDTAPLPTGGYRLRFQCRAYRWPREAPDAPPCSWPYVSGLRHRLRDLKSGHSGLPQCSRMFLEDLGEIVSPWATA